jgi:ribose 5-phosphate isomerase
VGPITDAAHLDTTLRAIPGTVGTGLFLGFAPTVLVWDGARCRRLTREGRN